MESKMLKKYKRFEIEKSWEDTPKGQVNIIYTAYNVYDGDWDLFDGDKTLSGIKKKIDQYVK